MPDLAALFRPLIEHSHTVYFSYAVELRRLTYVSPAYEQLLGDAPVHAARDLRRWLARIHPDDRDLLREQVALVLQERQPLAQDVELRLRRPDGRRQWLCLTVGRSHDEQDGPLLTGSVRDITPIKEYMRNAKKNATLEILSHDLSGPLLIVQQLAEHVAEQSESYGNATLNELVRLMRTTCQESVTLIRDFVNQEFLESSNVELNLQRVDLAAKLRVVLNQYQHAQRLLHKRIGFETNAEPVYVYIDDNKFQQVINNLISNALKFTPDGGSIDVRLEKGADRVRLLVQDTGIGIPAKLQPLLFEKFTKARRTGLRGERPIGLGMSVIQTLVTLHEGRIWFESEEGRGSTFYIELPLLPEDVAPHA
ncbi:PAS domain-containing sensor histidine kinase [Hymenobacter gummosus]|nr:ATP-binding protein [Hymenobacter gummosus]